MTLNADFFSQHLQSEIPHLRRYAYSLAGHEAGDDLMQTALERALNRKEQFSEGTELRRWLFTITRNTFIDERRRSSRRGTSVPIEEWFQDTHMRPAQETRLELEDVTRSMDTLRPEDREVLSLRVFSGLSHDQIAHEVGIAVGTVKSRLSRARQALAA